MHLDSLEFAQTHSYDSTNPTQRNPFHETPDEILKKREVTLTVSGRRQTHTESVVVTIPRSLFRRLFGLKAKTRIEDKTVEEQVFVGIDVKLTSTITFTIRRDKDMGRWDTGGTQEIALRETKLQTDKDVKVLLDSFLPAERVAELSTVAGDAVAKLGQQLGWAWSGGISRQATGS
ncbi:MAG: hypothetical protein JRN34_05035 [Nitrososphaerota archaeon]|nr:hypothetical protein [Nitrososphaerota archaeon]MDG6950451.1 hypothetical protein [Nitrososphaerota archaeon]